MRQTMDSGRRVVLGLVLITLLSLFSFLRVGLAQNLAAVPAYVQSPVHLSHWLKSEFSYETEMPDRWQPAEETVAARKGDCEDFAILAKAVLEEMNIAGEILIINFKGLRGQAHAVCIFKNNDYYSIISNQQLIKTRAATIEAAMDEQYPDWESITFTTENREELKFVSRANSASPSACPAVNTASR